MDTLKLSVKLPPLVDLLQRIGFLVLKTERTQARTQKQLKSLVCHKGNSSEIAAKMEEWLQLEDDKHQKGDVLGDVISWCNPKTEISERRLEKFAKWPNSLAQSERLKICRKLNSLDKDGSTEALWKALEAKAPEIVRLFFTKCTDPAQKPAEPYPELSQFAATFLKGKQRLLVETVIKHPNGYPLGDFATEPSVGWRGHRIDQCFKSLKNLVNPKIEKFNFRVARHKCAIHLERLDA